MQRTVLEKYIFNQPLIDIGINNLTRTDNIIQRHTLFDDNQRPYLAFTHAHTGKHYRHNVRLLGLLLLISRQKAEKTAQALMRTQRNKKTAQLILK